MGKRVGIIHIPSTRWVPMKVLVVYKGLAERIRARLPDDIEVVYPEVGTDEELIALAKDVEVIVSPGSAQ